MTSTVPSKTLASSSATSFNPFSPHFSFRALLSRFWPYLLLFILPFLIYGQTASFGYSGFDDTGLIHDNLALLADWSNWRLPFTSDAWLFSEGSFYRPLQSLSYMLDISLSGGQMIVARADLSLFHLHNVFLFAVFTLVLFYLLEDQFRFSRPLALTLSLFVVVNPFFVTAVGWLPARGDLQLALFALLTLVFFINLVRTQHWHYFFLTALSFALALFAKESALTLPPLLLFYFFAFEFQSSKAQASRAKTVVQKKKSRQSLSASKKTSSQSSNQKNQFSALFKNPRYFLLALSFILTALIWQFLRSQMYLSHASISITLTNFLYNLRAFPEIIAKFFFPYNLALIPLYSWPLTILGLILIIIALFFIFPPFQKSPSRPPQSTSQPQLKLAPSRSQKLFGWCWCLLALLPAMVYRFTDMTIFFDFLNHRSLFPLIGVIIFLGLILNQTNFSFFHPRFSSTSRRPLSSKKPSLSKSSSNFNLHNPTSSKKASSSLSSSSNQVSFSSTDCRRSFLFQHRFFLVLLVLFLLILAIISFIRIKAFADPITYWTAALKHNQSRAKLYINRAGAYSDLGDLDLARADFDTAIALQPEVGEGFNGRAILRASQGDLKGALLDYTAAIEAGSTRVAWIYLNRAGLKKEMLDYQGALEDYALALEIEPTLTEAYKFRSNIYLTIFKDYVAAEAELTTALALDPTDPELYNDRGIVRADNNDPDGARQDWRAALALDPTNPMPRHNLRLLEEGGGQLPP